jgi:hypothetical protein
MREDRFSRLWWRAMEQVVCICGAESRPRTSNRSCRGHCEYLLMITPEKGSFRAALLAEIAFQSSSRNRSRARGLSTPVTPSIVLWILLRSIRIKFEHGLQGSHHHSLELFATALRRLNIDVLPPLCILHCMSSRTRGDFKQDWTCRSRG